MEDAPLMSMRDSGGDLKHDPDDGIDVVGVFKAGTNRWG